MVICMKQSVVFLRNKAAFIREYVFIIDSIQMINIKEMCRSSVMSHSPFNVNEMNKKYNKGDTF